MIELIAEIGSVHDGSFGNAIKLVESAASCGATAVKFQTHIAEAETLRDAPNPPYFKGEPRFEYFKRTGFSVPQWKELKVACATSRVDFMSSAFSLEAVDLLEEVGIASYKIPSGEVTNLPLLRKIATTGKPVFLSSGMSNWSDLDAAVESLEGSSRIVVMQCSSVYPCPPETVGLNVLNEMRSRYGTEVGFSDHTLGIAAPIAAAALGAVAVEKHFTFSRLMYGSDAANASEPSEFRLLADAIREIDRMLSHPVDKGSHSRYSEMKRIFEKSIVAACDLSAGTVLRECDLQFKKPGDGIPAARWRDFIGKRLRMDVRADHKFSESDVES